MASTFIGSTGNDLIDNIMVFRDDNLYCSGITSSDIFPTTDNVFDETYNGSNDGFIIKIDNNLSASKKIDADGLSISITRGGCFIEILTP